jgi:glycosyltransferase involved in cell wall biosynthesis
MKLRVGVPAGLLALPPHGGHGKVWHRVLAELRRDAGLVALDETGRAPWPARLRGLQVALADGHGPLPAVGVPLVAEVHEAGWFEPELRERIDPGFLAEIEPRTAHALAVARQVITLSHASRRDLIAHYGLDPERVHAVHPGVDPGFRPGLEGGSELVARHRGGRSAPYVLFAASLHPRKNLDALREAMSALVARGLPHVLAIAGSPAPDRPDSAELARLAAAPLDAGEDRVALIAEPSDEQLAALMAGAAAFCLPSLYEGFGLTAAEAMACGAAVVVSDRGALPEVVGQAGVVCPPTARALADALGALLADEPRRSALGRAAAARASQLTWQRTAAGWLAVLRAAALGRA